ncbi:unnamed protein product [Trichobilharzia regenti]|nr:unnamed protein product [Trichobilharzia regenti]
MVGPTGTTVPTTVDPLVTAICKLNHNVKALPPTYKHPTVLKRLNAEPDLSAFVQSLPSDLKRKLDEPDSDEWYTVFAVPNNVWNQMTSGISSSEVSHIVTIEDKGQATDSLLRKLTDIYRFLFTLLLAEKQHLLIGYFFTES